MSDEMFEAGALDFDQWMGLVDEEVARITDGFSTHDFPNWDYADAYDGGIEPNEAARLMLGDLEAL